MPATGPYEHCSPSVATSCLQALHDESRHPRFGLRPAADVHCRPTLQIQGPSGSNLAPPSSSAVKLKSCSDIILHGSVLANAATDILLDSARLSNQEIIHAVQVFSNLIHVTSVVRLVRCCPVPICDSGGAFSNNVKSCPTLLGL